MALLVPNLYYIYFCEQVCPILSWHVFEDRAHAWFIYVACLMSSLLTEFNT